MTQRQTRYRATRKVRPTMHELMPEASLQGTIMQAASLQGYLCYHTNDSRLLEPGFLDLVIAGHGRLIFWELKSANGTVSPEQQQWLDALSTVVKPPLVEVIRPADLDRCLKVLSRR